MTIDQLIAELQRLKKEGCVNESFSVLFIDKSNKTQTIQCAVKSYGMIVLSSLNEQEAKALCKGGLK